VHALRPSRRLRAHSEISPKTLSFASGSIAPCRCRPRSGIGTACSARTAACTSWYDSSESPASDVELLARRASLLPDAPPNSYIDAARSLPEVQRVLCSRGSGHALPQRSGRSRRGNFRYTFRADAPRIAPRPSPIACGSVPAVMFCQKAGSRGRTGIPAVLVSLQFLIIVQACCLRDE